MSGKGKRLRWPVIFILVLCIFSLGFHFMAEGFLRTGSQTVHDVTGSEVLSDSFQDTCEDCFTFPAIESVQSQPIHVADDLLLTGASVFSASPLLLPPNF